MNHNDFNLMRQWIRNEISQNVTIKSIDITTDILNEKESSKFRVYSSIFIHCSKSIKSAMKYHGMKT